MVDYPGPNATRAEIEAWEAETTEARLMPLAREIAAMILRGKPKVPICEACRRKTTAAPLIERCRIKHSAKYKGRLFEVGAVLCHKHQTDPVQA